MAKRRRTSSPRRRTAPRLRLMRVVTLLIVVGAIYVLRSFAESHDRSNNPTGAIVRDPSTDYTAVRTNPDLQSLDLSYAGMNLSFNNRMHQPNWVAWELTADETTGNVGRASKFMVDAEVAGCADPADYTNSGYDRGHMAPAGDMKWSADAMSHTFYMTNICPQDKALNTGAWKSLEEKCRTWARAEEAIVIVCGPVLTDPLTRHIGQSKIPVPQRFFKVILAPYADPPRGIGFMMNNGKVEGGMQAAATTIDEVERITGHDFFWQLPDSIENIVEAQCDFNFWSTIK